MKTIWTYTKLAQRAMRMAANYSDEFALLRSAKGSNQFIKGLRVKWNAGARRSCFEFHGLRKSRKTQEVTTCHLATVYGNKRDGKMYTYWEFGLRSTTYRKREVGKYLPISLPNGVRSDHYTHCDYHRVDGTIAMTGLWHGKSRGLNGEPDIPVCHQDETGELVPKSFVESMKLDCHYQSAWYDLGWHPDAAKTRREWIEAIHAMPAAEGQAAVDQAHSACKMAMELTAEYPDIRMFLIPPEKLDGSRKATVGRFSPNGRRDRFVTFSGNGDWYLPRVVLYWFNDQQSDGESNWTSVDLVVPPYSSLCQSEWFKVSDPELLVQVETRDPKAAIPHSGGMFSNMRIDQVKAAIECKFVIDTLPML